MLKRIAGLLLLTVGLACNSGTDSAAKGAAGKAEGGPRFDAPEGGDTPPPAADAGGDEGPAAEAPAAGSLDPLLAWLDPDAVGAALMVRHEGLDPEVLEIVFALPPRLVQLLEPVGEIDEWLPTYLAEGAPAPDEIFGPTSLVFAPAFSTGRLVVRRLAKPRADVEKWLGTGKLDRQEAEGFTIFVPSGALPYRIVMLDEHAVAFIPLRDPGSGLSPLTAGRDLPPSDLERALRKAFEETPALIIESHMAGPMMHFDFDPPVVEARFEMLPYAGGLEGRVALRPQRELEAVVAALDGREPTTTNDAIAELAGKVAYQADAAGVVLGRLQVPTAELGAFAAEH